MRPLARRMRRRGMGEEEEGAAQRVCGTSHFVKHMKSTPCLFIAEGTTAVVGAGDR